jgi:hypothetical protein
VHIGCVQALLSQRWDLPPFLCDLCPTVVVLSGTHSTAVIMLPMGKSKNYLVDNPVYTKFCDFEECKDSERLDRNDVQ